MSQRTIQNRNEFHCAIETNQNGKYTVRIRASFGRRDWELRVYFLASSFDRAMKKLEDALQYLQRHEERLWFWGVDRSDDPALAGDLLKEIGLGLDRRGEFPRRAAVLSATPDRPVPPFSFAAVRRVLANTVSVERAVAAGD